MDVKDISSDGQYLAFLQQIQAAAEKAARRKGEKPRDHPPPHVLVQRLLMNLRVNQSNLSKGSGVFATSQIPAPYLPCTLPAAELKPITISQMRLEEHHQLHSIVVRLLTPPNRMTAIMAIVEDTEGTAVVLQLYHQAPEDVVPAAKIFTPGTLLLLKEPFFKAATDGSYSLRADHVSDVMILGETDELVPLKWRKSPATTAGLPKSSELRARGNEAVGKKDWVEAQQLYSSAIDAATTPEESQLALLNRSLAHLRLGQGANALRDATHASAIEVTEKALFREASALYQADRFEACLARLEILTRSFPTNEAVGPMLARVKARLAEQKDGEYDFRAMYAQARATPPLIDCATYSAPVEVRMSPGKGAGLFTTRKVRAGDLLLCEKALGYEYAGDDQPGRSTILMNVATKRMTFGGQAGLLTQMVQKLYADPEMAKSFVDLYHGDYQTVAADEVDGKPVVDSFLVERVIALTGFGSPRTSRNGTIDRMSAENESKKEDVTYTTSGIYHLASRINHACTSNSHRSFIGNVQIVRATRDLEPDTEVTFWYQVPLEFDDYAETQKKLSNWGFKCQCGLCFAKMDTPRELLTKRKALHEEDLKKALGTFNEAAPRPINMSKARKVLDQIGQTYIPSQCQPGAVRLELWDPYIALGRALLVSDKRGDAIEATVRGLEALGFIITANHPRRGPKSSGGKPEFRVRRWGLTDQCCIDAFLTLFRAYKNVAPELATVAKDCVGTAYSIVVGEKDTLLDRYPELR